MDLLMGYTLYVMDTYVLENKSKIIENAQVLGLQLKGKLLYVSSLGIDYLAFFSLSDYFTSLFFLSSNFCHVESIAFPTADDL